MLTKVTPSVKFWNRFISPAGRNTNLVISYIEMLEEKNPTKYPQSDIFEKILPDKKIALLRGNRDFSQFFMIEEDKIQAITRKLIDYDTHSKIKITKINLSDKNKNVTKTVKPAPQNRNKHLNP